MDLGYSNDMINTDNRTLGENIFGYITVIRSWHKVGKSGRDFLKWVWQDVYIFYWEIIFLMTS